MKLLGDLIEPLAKTPSWHARDTWMYQDLSKWAKEKAWKEFGPGQSGGPFGPFGDIVFPFRSFGAVNTVDLLGIDDLSIFAFYWENRKRYRRAADIGANVGLHSLILARCGYDVRSYEPDPTHFSWLAETLLANKADEVAARQVAVSDKWDSHEFVRVLGNTTGSHLAGAKKNPYGDLDRISVGVMPFSEVMEWADLIKIDAEGSEAPMILSTNASHWKDTDAFLEVGSEDIARAILDHCNDIGVNIFAQKSGWGRAKKLEDLPHSCHEGNAFLSCKEEMW